MSGEPRKAVWIDLGRGFQLRTDGPALRIDGPHSPPLWVPWHRLELLVLEGDGILPTALLAEAGRHGVRIRFNRGSGAVYDLEPAETIADSLDAQWDLLLELPGWRQSWQAWRLRQTLWAVARTLGQPVALGDALRHLHPLSLCPRLGLPRDATARALAALHGELRLDARHLLRDAGWSPARLRRPRPGPAVGRHLRRMLAFEMLRHWRRGLPVEPGRWYARERSALLQRGRASLDGVLRWLADITCALP